LAYYNPYASPEQIVSDLISTGQWFPTGMAIAFVVAAPPAIAVTSRRLHDMNITGWAAVVTLIPTIGQIASIVIGLPGGAAGDNRYGPNPLGQKA
jgi:uncharacterized membrane protein YhaH (DUF805 family)